MEQIKRGDAFRKIRESSSKKKEISLYDTRTRGKVQKCTEMHNKKRKQKCRKCQQKKRLMTRYRRGSIRTFRPPKRGERQQAYRYCQICQSLKNDSSMEIYTECINIGEWYSRNADFISIAKVYINEKGGGKMQFQTLKAVKSSDSQFHIMIASIAQNSEGKYEGILMVADKKKPKSKYEASDIHIVGRNKETVYRQIREIAGLYPPIKKDVIILDAEEMKKLYEK